MPWKLVIFLIILMTCVFAQVESKKTANQQNKKSVWKFSGNSRSASKVLSSLLAKQRKNKVKRIIKCCGKKSCFNLARNKSNSLTTNNGITSTNKFTLKTVTTVNTLGSNQSQATEKLRDVESTAPVQNTTESPVDENAIMHSTDGPSGEETLQSHAAGDQTAATTINGTEPITQLVQNETASASVTNSDLNSTTQTETFSTNATEIYNSTSTTAPPNLTIDYYSMLPPMPADPAVIEANSAADLENAMLGIPSSFSMPFAMEVSDGQQLDDGSQSGLSSNNTDTGSKSGNETKSDSDTSANFTGSDTSVTPAVGNETGTTINSSSSQGQTAGTNDSSSGITNSTASGGSTSSQNASSGEKSVALLNTTTAGTSVTSAMAVTATAAPLGSPTHVRDLNAEQ